MLFKRWKYKRKYGKRKNVNDDTEKRHADSTCQEYDRKCVQHSGLVIRRICKESLGSVLEGSNTAMVQRCMAKDEG